MKRRAKLVSHREILSPFTNKSFSGFLRLRHLFGRRNLKTLGLFEPDSISSETGLRLLLLIWNKPCETLLLGHRRCNPLFWIAWGLCGACSLCHISSSIRLPQKLTLGRSLWSFRSRLVTFWLRQSCEAPCHLRFRPIFGQQYGSPSVHTKTLIKELMSSLSSLFSIKY